MSDMSEISGKTVLRNHVGLGPTIVMPRARGRLYQHSWVGDPSSPEPPQQTP